MKPNLYCTAVIVAAGKGLRLKSKLPKQYLPLEGKPVLARTLDVFQSCLQIDEIVLVLGEGQEEYCNQNILSYGYPKVKKVVCGGEERQRSVYNGLQAADPATELVLIHDGARPILSRSDLERVMAAAAETGAAVLATRLKDTVKRATNSLSVSSTLDRNNLWTVQTPQAFFYSTILEAHEKALADGVLATDDSALLERLGHTVKLVEGSLNLKITTTEDLAIGSALLKGGYGESF